MVWIVAAGSAIGLLLMARRITRMESFLLALIESVQAEQEARELERDMEGDGTEVEFRKSED